MNQLLKTVPFLLAGCTVDNSVDCEPVDSIYMRTQECVGVSYEMPTIYYISFEHRGLGPVWAVYHVPSSSILVNEDKERTCEQNTQMFSEEFVHYLVRMMGDDYGSSSHSSQFFKLCGLGVDTHN